MKEVQTAEELMELLSNMNKENSICQVLIPGKGNFTIVLQQEDYGSLEQTVSSAEAENEGRAMSVSELTRNPYL